MVKKEREEEEEEDIDDSGILSSPPHESGIHWDELDTLTDGMEV